jgi:hypothetical protein
MDELTAVRQLLAERPPPAPDTVAAARASLERAGLRAADGGVPLHHSGGRNLPGLGEPARRRRWRGWLAPLAAALAVTTAVAVALAISSGISGRQAHKPAAHPAAAPFAQVPRYFVALTGGHTVPDQGRRAVVAATATGAVLGSVPVPPPYRVFTWVAAAGNDRTFVLAAQRAQDLGGGQGLVGGTGPATLYRLELRGSGRPGALRRLPVPPVSGNINGFALSPDGSKLAVSMTRAAGAATGSRIQVFTLATGARRSWVMSAVGWVGQDKPNAQSLVWAGDDRTLLFEQYLGEGGARAQIRLLDTAAPGGSLTAASTRVPFPSALISGRVEDPVQDYGNMLLLPDGHKIISVVATLTWHGRPGFPPSGGLIRTLRGLLPPQCRGTGGGIAKKTSYCTSRLKHLESGNSPALRRALRRNAAQQQAESSTALAFTEFSAATAKPVAVLARLQGEGQGITWADVTWVGPSAAAMIINGAWPKAGGGWPISHGGPPVAVAGVMTGGTFTPFPQRVQSLFFGGQATW